MYLFENCELYVGENWELCICNRYIYLPIYRRDISRPVTYFPVFNGNRFLKIVCKSFFFFFFFQILKKKCRCVWHSKKNIFTENSAPKYFIRLYRLPGYSHIMNFGTHFTQISVCIALFVRDLSLGKIYWEINF